MGGDILAPKLAKLTRGSSEAQVREAQRGRRVQERVGRGARGAVGGCRAGARRTRGVAADADVRCVARAAGALATPLLRPAVLVEGPCCPGGVPHLISDFGAARRG